MKKSISIFWFRRDLRISDNAGLYEVLKNEKEVLPIFIFDKEILSKLSDKGDRRVTFIYNTLLQLKAQFEAQGSTLKILYGAPLDCFRQLLVEYDVKSVYTNHDYEPYARQRDKTIGDFLAASAIAFHTFKDQVIFEKEEITKDDNTPYTVYTPYSKKWKTKVTEFYLKPYPTEKYLKRLINTSKAVMPSLPSMGFEEASVIVPSVELNKALVQHYHETRDIPSILGTSRLSVHLRFGTVSIRHLVREAYALNEKWLNELIWRDFYHMILWHFPKVEKAFKPKYDFVKWRNNEEEFKAWCAGKTGYPIVDAGMRELNATGYMHNRVRMIVASFLTKHLLIDWRWGEAYFAEKLLDFDLAANNGGWQWASGSGCDAAPYFRVFNPYLQTLKFDPEAAYIKKWVPEFQDPFQYPQPIVDHDFARKRVLEAYKVALE